MRDFLSNLVARSLPNEPVVRPYPAALFEPVGGPGPAMPADPAVEGEATAAEERPEGSTPVTPTPAASRQTAGGASEPLLAPRALAQAAQSPSAPRTHAPRLSMEQRSGEQRGTRPSTPSIRPAKAPGQLGETGATTSTARHRRAVDRPSFSPTREEGSPPPQHEPSPVAPPLTQPVARELVIERRIETRASAAPHQHPTIGPAGTVRQSPGEPRNASDPRTPRSRVEMVPDDEPRPVVARPLVRRMGEDEAVGRSLGRPNGEASEPTIHVTIGRVEVRAVQTPPRQRRERPQPAVMSLEEYLRLRANGGER